MGGYNGCSPASLAYIGDAVFELLVREKYIREYNVKSGKLHEKAVKVVNAASQAKMADKLLDILNKDETAVYKRGRNTSAHSMPKNAVPAEYCKATGFEAVFGYLYLEGMTERVNELFAYCMENIDG